MRRTLCPKTLSCPSISRYTKLSRLPVGSFRLDALYVSRRGCVCVCLCMCVCAHSQSFDCESGWLLKLTMDRLNLHDHLLLLSGGQERTGE